MHAAASVHDLPVGVDGEVSARHLT